MNQKKIKIYYAYPSALNYPTNSYNLNNVAQDFSRYDIIVLGNDLDNPSHPDHNKTINILNKSVLNNTEFYGYIRSGDNLNTNKNKIDNWKLMNIKGIFCAEFGFDFGITRNKQNALVDYIHSKGLKVMANSWNVSDIFDGLPNSKLNNNDWILLESYQIINDQYQNKNNWRQRSNKAINYKQIYGINVACITTTLSAIFNQNKFNYAYYSSLLDGFDAFGWGEKDYSASSSLMPYRQRPSVIGNKFTSNINENNGVFERQMNVGIYINTNTNQVSNIINN